MLRRVLILVALFLPCAAVRARDLQGEIPRLTDGLFKDAPALKGKHVAVGEFKDAAGQVTQLSGLISKNFEVGLVGHVKDAGIDVVDRGNVAQLAKEWMLGLTGAVDSASAKQVGKLVGVDVFCLGSYSAAGNTISVQATLVDAQTGKVLSGAAGDFKAADDVIALSEKVVKAADAPPPPPDPGALKVEVWSEQKELKAGDKVVIHAKANQDCYLTLIDVGTSGDATVIFPNEYAASNSVKGGVVYTIPDPAAGFEFEASGPAGTEIVRAIASKIPAIDLKDAMEGFSPDKPFGGVKDPPVMTRDIHVHARKAKKGEWNEAVLKLAIR